MRGGRVVADREPGTRVVAGHGRQHALGITALVERAGAQAEPGLAVDDGLAYEHGAIDALARLLEHPRVEVLGL
jgi:hypothetical protein